MANYHCCTLYDEWYCKWTLHWCKGYTGSSKSDWPKCSRSQWYFQLALQMWLQILTKWFGQFYIVSFWIVHRITWIQNHENFVLATFNNDISIITLEEPLDLNDPDIEVIQPLPSHLHPGGTKVKIRKIYDFTKFFISPWKLFCGWLGESSR